MVKLIITILILILAGACLTGCHADNAYVQYMPDGDIKYELIPVAQPEQASIHEPIEVAPDPEPYELTPDTQPEQATMPEPIEPAPGPEPVYFPKPGPIVNGEFAARASALAAQMAGTWRNNLGETLVIPATIPEGRWWDILETPDGSFRIVIQIDDCPAHYEMWFFPLGAEMIRWGTTYLLAVSDLSRARIYYGTFSLTSCCPDEEINRRLFFPIEDDAPEYVITGYVLGDVLFREIAVSRLFIEPFVDVLGFPQLSSWPFDVYEGIEIMGDRGHLAGLPNMAIMLWAQGRDLHLFELNGISLDMTRPQIIDAFGDITDYPEAGSLTFHISNIMTDYMLTFRFENPDDKTEVTSISMGREYWQVE